jgi:hypothetical protein
VHTAVGEDLLNSQAAIGNMRYILEASATNPNPAIQAAVPKIFGLLMDSMKLDITLDDLDQGQRKAQQTAFGILTSILGEGIPMMPLPDDPDETYLGVFKGCYDEIMLALQDGKPNHWVQKAPQNIPLLGERINQQMAQLQFKQQQAEMQAMRQQAMQMQLQADNDPRGNQPEKPKKAAATRGEARQQQGT